jgi:signal transduction histidine kinase
MKIGSIRGRMLVWSAGLTVAALMLAWLTLSAVLSDFVNRRLEAELVATARGIMTVAEWNDEGGFSVLPAPADPRFEAPLSGWYWQVSDGQAVLARAPSLVTGDLGLDGSRTTGPDGAVLRLQGSRFTAPGDGRVLTVAVTLPEAEARAELAAIRQPLALALFVLGGALLGAQVLAVRAGLVDLRRFAGAVAAVRDGKADALPDAEVAELRPLSAELNRLIAANATQMERARAHAGDLAHALKTPLAVLANRAGPEDAALIDRMDSIIRWQLKRARAAAAGLDPAARADVAAVLDDLALVLGPEVRRRGLAFQIDADDAPEFRGDPEDLAEITGALAENAVKWARSTVQITTRAEEDGHLSITVRDDGPGIPQSDRARLMARGARLDEAMPGHGLGLAIAADRVAAYGGRLDLHGAPGGGLEARVSLPAWPRA